MDVNTEHMGASNKLCLVHICCKPDISVGQFYTKTYNTALYFFLTDPAENHILHFYTYLIIIYIFPQESSIS